MMWIVKIALRAPYTFTVLAVLLLIGGALSTLQMAKNIFPAINIPVVGIIWTYNGLPAQEMAQRITTVSERASTTNVNNIEHTVSETYPILEIKPQWVREREGMGSKKSFGMGFGVIDGLQGVRQICGSFKGEFSQWKHLLPVGE